jgi:hypothetical protein
VVHLAIAALVGEYTSDGVKIKSVSDHAQNKMFGLKDKGFGPVDPDGVNSDAMLDALRNPLHIEDQPGGTRIYFGKDADVVINPKTGNIVTTWARTAAGKRFLSPEDIGSTSP